MSKQLKNTAVNYYQDKYIKAPITKSTLDKIENDIRELRYECWRDKVSAETGNNIYNCFCFLVGAQNTIIDELCKHNSGPQHLGYRLELEARKLKLDITVLDMVTNKDSTIKVDLNVKLKHGN